MNKYNYGLKFSPYQNSIKAKNLADAKSKIKAMWSEYNIDDVLIYLMKD